MTKPSDPRLVSKTTREVYQCGECREFFNWATAPPAQEILETVKLGHEGKPGPATMGRFYCPGCAPKHPNAKVRR